MSEKLLSLTPDLRDYLLNHSLRESPWLTQLREETAQIPGAIMQIAPEQGQLMALLVKLLGVRRALEVGVFTGYSALAVALALPEGGELVACDVDAQTTAIAQRYWQAAGVADRITLKLGPAVETLDQLLASGAGGSFDWVFIDADKRNYDRYYEQALDLLRPGGVILVDNVLWFGRVLERDSQDLRTQAIQAFNAKLHRDPRIDLSMLAIADGLTLARKRDVAG